VIRCAIWRIRLTFEDRTARPALTAKTTVAISGGQSAKGFNLIDNRRRGRIR